MQCRFSQSLETSLGNTYADRDCGVSKEYLKEDAERQTSLKATCQTMGVGGLVTVLKNSKSWIAKRPRLNYLLFHTKVFQEQMISAFR